MRETYGKRVWMANGTDTTTRYDTIAADWNRLPPSLCIYPVKLKCNAKCNRSTLANGWGGAGHGRAIIAGERIKLIARNGKFQLSNDSLQNSRGNYALARTLVTHRNNRIVHNQFQPRAGITLPRLHQSLTRLSCNRAS